MESKNFFHLFHVKRPEEGELLKQWVKEEGEPIDVRSQLKVDSCIVEKRKPISHVSRKEFGEIDAQILLYP